MMTFSDDKLELDEKSKLWSGSFVAHHPCFLGGKQEWGVMGGDRGQVQETLDRSKRVLADGTHPDFKDIKNELQKKKAEVEQALQSLQELQAKGGQPRG